MRLCLQNWVALGSVDLDEVVEERLKDVQDWQLNLNVLKSAAKEAQRLPNTVRHGVPNLLSLTGFKLGREGVAPVSAGCAAALSWQRSQQWSNSGAH